MKKIHLVLKTLFSIALAGSAIGKLTAQAPLVETFTRLGYPDYLLNILGIAYLLGIVALWQSKSLVLREWAFSSFSIALIGAASSHILAGDPISQAIPAVVLLGLLFSVYYFSKQDK